MSCSMMMSVLFRSLWNFGRATSGSGKSMYIRSPTHGGKSTARTKVYLRRRNLHFTRQSGLSCSLTSSIKKPIESGLLPLKIYSFKKIQFSSAQSTYTVNKKTKQLCVVYYNIIYSYVGGVQYRSLWWFITPRGRSLFPASKYYLCLFHWMCL